MHNQLLTKPIEKALLAGAAIRNATAASKVVAKFFTPDAQATWFIVEGEKLDDGDWQLFGLCDLGMGSPELGYVMLSELRSIRGGLGLPVERDLYYSKTLGEAAREVGYELFDREVA